MVLAKRYCVEYVDGTRECFREDGFWYSDVCSSFAPLGWFKADNDAEGHNPEMGHSRLYIPLLHDLVRWRIYPRKATIKEGATVAFLPSCTCSYPPMTFVVQVLTHHEVPRILLRTQTIRSSRRPPKPFYILPNPTTTLRITPKRSVSTKT